MSTRTLTRLLGAAGALFGLWLAISFLGSAGGEDGEPDGEWADFFDRLNRVTVSEVRIDGEDGQRVIAREGSSWTIDGLRADSGTVARFWDSVEDASVGGPVSRNPDNQDRMGLAEGSAHSMTFELDGESRTLLVGDAGGSAGTSFVRRPGSDESYVLSSNFNAHMVRALNDWRDRRVVIIDTASVGRIELTAGDGAHTVSRGDSAWTVANGAEADPGAVRAILEELAVLRANGFAEADNEVFDAPAELSLTALDGAGDTLAVLTLGEGDGDRWVTARGDTTVYRLPSFRTARLIPDGERLQGN